MASSIPHGTPLLRLRPVSPLVMGNPRLPARPTSIPFSCREGVRCLPSLQLRVCIGEWLGSPRSLYLKRGSCFFGKVARRSRAGCSSRACADPVVAGDGGDSSGKGRVRWDAKGKFLMETAVRRLEGVVVSVSPVMSRMHRNMGSIFIVALSVAFAMFVVSVWQKIIVAKHNEDRHGSVADLVKRGQLRSDRRGISKPLRYEDPFNNPLVKKGRDNSTVEICGKIYRLAPVILTEEQQSTHQRRRSRAYKWKRPTIFLKEGDQIPPDVDPDTVRWIPANHPFATTVSDIDENLAQSNVYQKNGVPFRIRAEHEELQQRLEKLQHEQKLNKVALNPNSFRDFDSSVGKSVLNEQQEPSPNLDQQSGQNPSTCQEANSADNTAFSEELKRP